MICLTLFEYDIGFFITKDNAYVMAMPLAIPMTLSIAMPLAMPFSLALAMTLANPLNLSLDIALTLPLANNYAFSYAIGSVFGCHIGYTNG